MMKRTEWLDYSKGIGIILVVFAHCISSIGPRTMGVRFLWISIYTMHMPLFFVLSGFTLKTNRTIIEFIKKRFLRLIGAYWLFAIINSFFEICIDLVRARDTTIRDIESNILEIITMSINSRYSYLWFFPVMFWACIIAYLLIKYFEKLEVILLLSIGLVFVNRLLSDNNLLNTFGIREALCVQIYIIIGYYLNRFIDKIKELSNHVLLLGVLFMWLLGSYEWLNTENITVDYWNSNISPFSWAFFLGMIGTLAVIVLAFAEDKKKTFIYKMIVKLGNLSLYIYGIHQLFLIHFTRLTLKISFIPESVKLVPLFLFVMFSSVLVSIALDKLHKRIDKKSIRNNV